MCSDQQEKTLRAEEGKNPEKSTISLFKEIKREVVEIWGSTAAQKKEGALQIQAVTVSPWPHWAS